MFSFREAIQLLRTDGPTDLRSTLRRIEAQGPRLFLQPNFVGEALYVLIEEIGLNQNFVLAEMNRFVEDRVWNALSRLD